MRRQHEIELASGDVRKIVVVRLADHVRVAVYQGTEVGPLIQAILRDEERRALIRALSDP